MIKLGYYCRYCDTYCDPLREKLYTVNEKTVHGFQRAAFAKRSTGENMSTEIEPWPGFGPGTFALPRQRSTRLSYQGADTKRI